MTDRRVTYEVHTPEEYLHEVETGRHRGPGTRDVIDTDNAGPVVVTMTTTADFHNSTHAVWLDGAHAAPDPHTVHCRVWTVGTDRGRRREPTCRRCSPHRLSPAHR
jgi:hypothetical protein